MEHIKFPKIESFRNLLYEVRSRVAYENHITLSPDAVLNLPTLTLVGTVKLHGTNAAVCYDPKTDELWFQSRSNILGDNATNMGFPSEEIRNVPWRAVFGKIPNPNQEPMAIFGEWCGKGIQQTVAISKLEKFFMIFEIKVGDEFLFRVNSVGSFPESRVFNIEDYPGFLCSIDLNDPEKAAGILAEMTDAVEARCPVGAAFGVEGVGEGIVWQVITPGWEDPRYWFKTKGPKHQVTETKEKVPVSPEMVASIQEFVQMTVTENRCRQGLQVLTEQGKPLDRSSTGDFIRWIQDDINQEEGDAIAANQLDQKLVNNAVATAAREWYFKSEPFI